MGLLVVFVLVNNRTDRQEVLSNPLPLNESVVVCVDVCVWFEVRLWFCIHTWEHTIFFHWVQITVRVHGFCFVCEIPLGAVAPAGQGCPPVSWQSSGSHGNEAQDAPTPDLWYSPPPEELQNGELNRANHSGLILKCMNMRSLKGASKNC